MLRLWEVCGGRGGENPCECHVFVVAPDRDEAITKAKRGCRVCHTRHAYEIDIVDGHKITVEE